MFEGLNKKFRLAAYWFIVSTFIGFGIPGIIAASAKVAAHLLGIGDPMDLFGAVENGCDLFDCVAPTREARNGSIYTKRGRFNIENTKYRTDFAPIEDDCECYMCKNFTKAYLSHLFRSNEILANTLASIHNVHFIVKLVEKMRKSILDGDFSRFRDDFLKSYGR